jgi:protein-tyrosine phosphatase
MIDIHCHLLPGLDDGPADLEESLQLARMAADQGIRTCVATPHFYVGLYTPDKATIRHEVDRLNEHLSAQGIALQVLPGMEVALTPEILSHFEDDVLLGLNGTSFLLVEPSRLSTPETIQKACSRLLELHTTPILAHPERNPLLQKHPEMLLDLVREGLLLQVSAANLDSRNQKTYACVRFLLEHRSVHVIASDAHSPLHRPPLLKGAVEEAGRILNSREEALALVTSIPEQLISGKVFAVPAPLIPEPSEQGWKRFIPFLR